MRSMLRRVLIETYWNVKDSDRQMIRPETSVLIETYWNVKEKKLWKNIKRSISINRNILECKGLLGLFVCFHISVLIETYWNVKYDEVRRLNMADVY